MRATDGSCPAPNRAISLDDRETPRPFWRPRRLRCEYPAQACQLAARVFCRLGIVGRLRHRCRVEAGMGGGIGRHRLDQLRHAGVDRHAVGRLDPGQLRSRAAEPAADRDLVMAAHDRDRQIVAVALEPELVGTDARAEVELAARRRARRRAVDDPVLPAAMAELVGVVAATSRQHIVAGAAEQHVIARAAGGVRADERRRLLQCRDDDSLTVCDTVLAVGGSTGRERRMIGRRRVDGEL